MNKDKIKEMLSNESKRLRGIEFTVTNGGNFYSVWFGGMRYGEARIEGKELVLYADRIGNDHEIYQWPVEKIPM